MLGAPHASAATLAGLFGLGLLLAAAVFARHGRGHRRAPAAEQAVALALAAAVVALPYAAWRVIEDVRYTHGLGTYERNAAGPIQVYLPGYLADRVAQIVPPGATYATVVGPAVPYSAAAKAFPWLVGQALFPRHSAPLGSAQWVVVWGAPARAAGPHGRVVVAHPRQGPLPPVLVAEATR